MDGIRMLGALVLVRRQLADTVGGLVLSGTPTPTGYCEVVAHGPDVEGLQPGQQVVMDAQGGTDVRFAGEALVVFRHDQVMAVVDGVAAAA